MTSQRPAPTFPLAVRVMNAAGGALRTLGVPIVRLDEASLLEEARRKTGLDDFGDDGFREGLRRLLDSYEREAALTVLGRMMARRDAVRLLENRLRMVDTWKRYPEILRSEIARPIFILGLPRTGTTILHELLAQDPANRVPMTWEVMHPWPPPERATYETDPRIAQVAAHLAQVDRLLPSFKTMHPMGATLPQECVAMTAHDFASMLFHTANRVPSYQAWLERADLRPAYASHRRQLQYLQWRCPGDRWVLKSPGHLWALDALLTVYPDARVIQTHRDPVRVLASLANLVPTLRGLAMDPGRNDVREIGEDWAARLAAGLEDTTAVRERALTDAARVFDLRFKDFIGDEIGAIQTIYTHFGLELGTEAQARMRRFLEQHSREKRGTHRYSLDGTGLDESTERRRFAAYQERYGIASESVR